MSKLIKKFHRNNSQTPKSDTYDKSNDMQKNARIVETLQSYKKLSCKADNHTELLKEKTVLLYTAALMESPRPEVVSLCLDILEDFVRNEKAHTILIGTFGVFEALEWLTISLRNTNPEMSKRASKLVDALRFSTPPSFSTRNHAGKIMPSRKGSSVHHLHVENLSTQNIRTFEETLVQIGGVVSFVTDLQKQRCTVRIGNKTTIHSVLTRILNVCGLRVSLIRKKPGKEIEVYQDVLKEVADEPCVSDYLSDEDDPPKEKCVANKDEVCGKSSGWLTSAAKFWNKSFYW